MAGFYHTLQKKGLRIKWPFFATSHGKGVIDGLGETVKRMVFTLCKDHSTILKVSQHSTMS